LVLSSESSLWIIDIQSKKEQILVFIKRIKPYLNYWDAIKNNFQRAHLFLQVSKRPWLSFICSCFVMKKPLHIASREHQGHGCTRSGPKVPAEIWHVRIIGASPSYAAWKEVMIPRCMYFAHPLACEMRTDYSALLFFFVERNVGGYGARLALSRGAPLFPPPDDSLDSRRMTTI
jgi:hypothetical protein